MVERLDRLSPETAPHGFYVAFRYVTPKSEDALRAMAADGVERAVAFTQYPQFSCSTTGSSLNELWRAAERTGLRDAFEWSIIDRWPVHDGFIAAMTETVREGLEQFDPADRDQVLLLFSAHSLPLDVDRSRRRRTRRRSAPACRRWWSGSAAAEPLPAGLPVGGRAGALARPEHGAGDPAARRARAEARAGGADRVHQRPHRDAVGAGPGVRRAGAPGGHHPLQAHARAQRAAAVHRRAGGHRARAPRVGTAVQHALPDPLPGLREPAVSADRESRGAAAAVGGARD